MVLVIGSQPSLWTSLGPFLGSALLFLGAMITLWVTNTRADKREWNKWRRDTLIKLCSDAVDAAQDVEAKCQSALSQNTHVFAQGNLSAASKSAGRIGTITEQLHLIGATELAEMCTRMKEAADAINLPASHLRTAQINAKSRREHTLKQINAASPGWKVKGSAEDAEYMSKIAEMHEHIHQELVAEHETRYADARGDLEKDAIDLHRRRSGRTQIDYLNRLTTLVFGTAATGSGSVLPASSAGSHSA